MDKNKSAVENFLGDLQGENKTFEDTPENPFDQLDNQTENTVENQVEEKEEKPLPFNKDPKIQKFIEKEISKRLSEYEVKEAPKTQGAEDEFKDVMDSLTLAIGNDTTEKVQALNAFKSALVNLDKRASEKAIAHLDEIKQKEIEADRQAEEELENAFENIEETYDVDFSTTLGKKTRQEFVSFIEKIAPKRNGEIVDYPDMNSAWETFQEIKKSTPQTNRAKDLASRSMARSSGTEAKPDIKNLNFDNILEHLQG
jgi:hypothetical protein